MRPFALCFSLSTLLFTTAAAQETSDKERAKLVGVWVGFAVEGKGEKPNQGPVKLELTITKDRVKATQFKGKDSNSLGEGTFELSTAKIPFTFDGDKKLDNPKRKEVWLGIYHLDGDTLKWCVRKKSRPTDFETKDGAFLMILKRVKK